MDRRTIIKASLAGILAFMIDGTIPDDVSARKIPEGTLSLYNTRTGERLKVSYRDASGRYDREALRELDYILRCHYTQKVRPMDIRAIEFLNAVDKALGGKTRSTSYRATGLQDTTTCWQKGEVVLQKTASTNLERPLTSPSLP